MALPSGSTAAAANRSGGHGGWIPGYVGSLRFYPARELAIAIQINSDVRMLGPEGAFDGIERGVAKAILGVSE